MPERRDVVIVGGGHNGLVTAFYLAKAGFKPLVLERRSQPGGAAITDEFHPGFRCSTLAHAAGPIRPDIIRDMQLQRHGLKLITPDVGVAALSPDGRALILHNDARKSAEEISKFSAKDASRYPQFQQSLAKMGKVIGEVLAMPPPNIDDPSKSDLWGMLQTGRAIRKLGKKDMYRLLRWGPMAVADLVSEFFETELLRAAIAARGIYGTFAGPWSAGTSLGVILQAATDSNAAGPAAFVRGGMGALTQSLAAAARSFGAEIRTGARVSRIQTKSGAVSGVVLSTGEEVPARAVVSNADPKHTLLSLIDPVDLDPDFIQKIRNYRASGALAKVHLALSQLPDFVAARSIVPNGSSALSGRIHVGPDIDYLERAYDAAKYGDFSPH